MFSLASLLYSSLLPIYTSSFASPLLTSCRSQFPPAFCNMTKTKSKTPSMRELKGSKASCKTTAKPQPAPRKVESRQQAFKELAALSNSQNLLRWPILCAPSTQWISEILEKTESVKTTSGYEYRFSLGVPLAESFDTDHNVLTLVQMHHPSDRRQSRPE